MPDWTRYVRRRLPDLPCPPEREAEIVEELAVQLEDMVGMEEQANLPGTVDGHPNWRRKMPVTLEDLSRSAIFQSVAGAVAAKRPRAP